jgi:FMN reductase
MAERTIAVISAGLSTPSSTRLLADRLAAATVAALGERDVEARVQVVELREHARALADRLVTGFADDTLQDALYTVAGADGIIAVTPVFTASYSGLFKTFVDVLEPDSLDGRPVLVAATAGTARHSLVLDHALRPLFTYLRTVVAPTGVFAAADDWGSTGLAERITRAAGELADLVAARPPVEVSDPFAAAASFEDLLAG